MPFIRVNVSAVIKEIPNTGAVLKELWDVAEWNTQR